MGLDRRAWAGRCLMNALSHTHTSTVATGHSTGRGHQSAARAQHRQSLTCMLCALHRSARGAFLRSALLQLLVCLVARKSVKKVLYHVLVLFSK
jgi:hypothetical protein